MTRKTAEGESEETHFDERLFRLLGIIGRDVSLNDLSRDLFVGLVLGFYHFELQGFVIISANDHIAGGDVSTITHEFVHVLQDQHFAISDYFDEHDDNTDAILAARFVAEGTRGIRRRCSVIWSWSWRDSWRRVATGCRG